MARPVPLPDAAGYFGAFGGRYVPETLMTPLAELSAAYDKLRRQRAFRRELAAMLHHYAGRPTPLFFAERLSADLGGARIFLKREDLLHTGAHKINNAIGQCLLARGMGKKRVVAETGAGQHGVATATAAAFLGLTCVVYMGSEDMRRQRLNVDRMRLLGAEVVPVDAGSCTLKDAINESLRDWVTHVRNTHYVLGSVLGPDPYPRMVRDFHRVIGDEARTQLKRQAGTDAPDLAIACVGGGSNAIGLFTAFLADKRVRMIGVEAGGRGGQRGQHAARFLGGALGVLHGTRTLVLQDEEGQISPTHSVSAGLDYPAVGPEHVLLQQSGRVEYTFATDAEAIEAFHRLAQTEGILPALESAHAVAAAIHHAPRLSRKRIILVNLSGRGDKDVESVIDYDRIHAGITPPRRGAGEPFLVGGHGWRATTATNPDPPATARARRSPAHDLAEPRGLADLEGFVDPADPLNLALRGDHHADGLDDLDDENDATHANDTDDGDEPHEVERRTGATGPSGAIDLSGAADAADAADADGAGGAGGAGGDSDEPGGDRAPRRGPRGDRRRGR